MYKLVYANWYMFYTNSHKRTCIIPICLCELVYLRFVDKNKKTAKSKKWDSPLSPGMWESVRSLPNCLKLIQIGIKYIPIRITCTNWFM